MHYKNGREAKVGDQIVVKNYDGTHAIEVVIAASAGSATCNLKTIPLLQNSNSRTASECLRVDDAINMELAPPSPAA